MNTKYKIGLALSGGGVMGIAHYGVLKQLEANNIPISIISGTSAGAIIGALFATGGSAKVESFLAYLDGAGVFKQNSFFFPGSLFSTIRVALEKYLGITDFKQLKIPFICIATDIATGEEVILEKGNIIDAVMASAAYPGVFATQFINGRNLVDGGVVRNLPVTELKERGANFIIGSSLCNITSLDSKAKTGRIHLSRFDTIARAADIMQRDLAQKEIKLCNFCFYPPVSNFRWYQFDQLPKLKEVGDEYAKKHMDKLIDLLNK